MNRLTSFTGFPFRVTEYDRGTTFGFDRGMKKSPPAATYGSMKGVGTAVVSQTFTTSSRPAEKARTPSGCRPTPFTPSNGTPADVESRCPLNAATRPAGFVPTENTMTELSQSQFVSPAPVITFELSALQATRFTTSLWPAPLDLIAALTESRTTTSGNVGASVAGNPKTIRRIGLM